MAKSLVGLSDSKRAMSFSHIDILKGAALKEKMALAVNFLVSRFRGQLLVDCRNRAIHPRVANAVINGLQCRQIWKIGHTVPLEVSQGEAIQPGLVLRPGTAARAQQHGLIAVQAGTI